MKFIELLENMKQISTQAIKKENGKYFVYNKKGDRLGSKKGYDAVQEAVKTLYYETLSTFKYMDMVKQDNLVNKYIERHNL